MGEVKRVRTDLLRETPEDELRARARRHVRARARDGYRPSDLFDAEDLQWAFDGRSDQLEALERGLAPAAAAGGLSPAGREDCELNGKDGDASIS